MQRRHFLIALAACGGWLPAAAQAVTFPPVRAGRALVFPADYGAHPDFRTEWWYATGWLRRRDASPLGFQITFFRVRTGIGEDNPSRFAPRQLLLAHAAIADPSLGRLRHGERAARSGAGRAGFGLGQTAVWIDDWSLKQEDAAAGSRYQAKVNNPDFAYELTLRSAAPPLLNGEQGFSRKAADPIHASYYYSRPQMTVDGWLRLGDGPDSARQGEPVSGSAWLDHEWSSELLPSGAQGWDWVGINFKNGSALMAFRLRDAAGAALWAAASLRSTGKIDQIFPPEVVRFLPQRYWRSPRSGISYPVDWQLQVADQVWTLEALMDDQELDSRRSVGAIYWEGAVRVSQRGAEVGEAYLELTGYGEKIRVG